MDMAAREGLTLQTQAADWLAKLQREDISAAERAELDHWLDADPAHAVAFARAEFAWGRAERLRALPALGREKVPAKTNYLWKAAAAISIVVIGAAVWYVTTQWGVYTTGLGERRTVS